MTESIREKRIEHAVKTKGRSSKWYMLRIAFWGMLLMLCFVMFMTGWMVGRYL